MMNLVEYPDAELMMMDLADELVSDLTSALQTHDTASFAVPGGTTPGPIFDVLSSVHLDWGRVSVFLTDERWVPEDSPRSNTRLVRERLLVGQAASARYVPLYAADQTPQEALPALTEGLVPHLPISVLLLGMGADMHTASLFPGAEGLDAALASDAPPLLPMSGGGAEEPRMTLTRPALEGALATHVVIKGSEKRKAVEAAWHLSPADAPIRVVLGAATIHWAP